MISALDEAHEKRLGSWDYGAATLSALKKRGWIRQVDVLTKGRTYSTTPEGERARDAILANDEAAFDAVMRGMMGGG